MLRGPRTRPGHCAHQAGAMLTAGSQGTQKAVLPGLPSCAHTEILFLAGPCPPTPRPTPPALPLTDPMTRLPQAVPPTRRPGPSEAPRAARCPTRRARLCCPAGRRAPSQADRAQTPRSAPAPERHAGRTLSDLGTEQGRQVCALASAGTRARPAHTASTRAGQLHGDAAVLPTCRAGDPRGGCSAGKLPVGPRPCACRPGSRGLNALPPHGPPLPGRLPATTAAGTQAARPPSGTGTTCPDSNRPAPHVSPQNAPRQHPAAVTR